MNDFNDDAKGTEINNAEVERDNEILTQWHDDPEVRKTRKLLLERRKMVSQSAESLELQALQDEATALLKAVRTLH
jgi:hypothetical protein